MELEDLAPLIAEAKRTQTEAKAANEAHNVAMAALCQAQEAEGDARFALREALYRLVDDVPAPYQAAQG